MALTTEVHPVKLNAEIASEGINIEYLDGRTVKYASKPHKIEKCIRCQPGKDVHVISIQKGRGEIVYVDELKTDHKILESTGVGKYLVPSGKSVEIFEGITAQKEGHSIEICVDFKSANGRLFVFQEDEFGELAHELIGDLKTNGKND